ncbi:hypothetical protein CI15_07615 [Paraburkholderia monticola]|uniref:TIR domain-containing protein n=1 Tax=Paraburkholderia monticola TaxID=1399968 RepID=A0A149PYE6_9BURK|nr:toll/interleukin-1 receptor domain-containing protein [Paraburkholderia monticola]KXU90029.1 hypothetical protein CI15_07615 [Paraburkholderia monticola]
MSTVFLSYARQDHFFAELLEIKLAEAKIVLWRDQGILRAGADWRDGIERGISACTAVLVTLSGHSTQSSYVTYEWAYAMGKGKPVIPLKLAECTMHPRLESIQYLDFVVPGASPWISLVERIRQIESEPQQSDGEAETLLSSSSDEDESTAKAILAYLNERGYQMASFERLRRQIEQKMTDEEFEKFIQRNSRIFRPATLRENRRGVAKRIP